MRQFDRRLAYHFDWLLVGLTLAITAGGIATIYSATVAREHGSFITNPLVIRQAFYAGIGFVGMVVAVFFDYRRLERYAYLLYALALVLLILVPLVGSVGGGARRWINLGVVSVGEQRSFVMADIPGLIEGAAEGAGLGIRFLKHLQRTRLLLHLVDIAPADPAADPVKDARAIVAELRKFSPVLAKKDRWLVLNKIDLLAGEALEKRCQEIVRRLRWKGPVYRISGVTGQGTRELCQAVMSHLEH